MTAGCLEFIRSPPETARKQKPVQKREVLAERQMNQGGFVDFSNYSPILFTNDIFGVSVDWTMMLFVEAFIL